MNWQWTLLNVFYTSIERSWFFPLHCVDVVYYMDLFSNVKPALLPRISPVCFWLSFLHSADIHYILQCILHARKYIWVFTNTLFKAFAFLITRVTGLGFSFFLGSLSGFVISYSRLLKWANRPCFSIFWKSLRGIVEKNLLVNPSGPGDLGNVFNYKVKIFTKNSTILVFNCF